MSAFVVPNDHIDALLTFAIAPYTYGNVSYLVNGSRIEINRQNVSEIGRILLDENERSVCHRYNDKADDTAASYRFKAWPFTPIAVSILKACDCFDYQACETDDYEQSVAHAIIDAIRKRAMRRVPGYDDADGWTFSRAKLQPAAAK
jgi:hypothetical protein